MAEEFFPYHVPHQSRRDRLRASNQAAWVQSLQAFVPLYDAPLPPPDFVVSGGGGKEHGANLTGLNPGHVYSDPQLSVQLNPSSVPDFVAGGEYPVPAAPFYRGVLDQALLGNEAVVYKPVGHQEQPINGAATGQTLSLSLSSQQINLPLELNLQKHDSSIFSSNVKEVGGSGSGPAAIELPKTSVPLGPFTGYSSVLKGSRFLRPAQQLLEEICDVGRGILAEIGGAGAAESSLLDHPTPLHINDGGDHRKKSRLLSLLDEVYKRYKQYYQQMQASLAAFEAVSGLSGAAPFAVLALKAMSKHFGYLKNAIIDQLQFSNKSHNHESRALENSSGSRHRYNQGFEPPVWRPQRGLPERAVAVLRAWLFEHFLHPYPTDTDKVMLAAQTGLTRNQVSNWFINARVRLWKPMVEEIHSLETRQNQESSSQRDHQQHQQQSATKISDRSQLRFSNDHEKTNAAAVQMSLKRIRRNPIENPEHDRNLLPNRSQTGLGVGNGSGGGVSLTLGLHQNAIGLPESYFPINAVRRLGLDPRSEDHLVAENAEFGTRGGGGQLMRDFVG